MKTLALQSTLVHAKETGEQKAVPYRFSQVPETPAYQEQCEPFRGALHVILNDRAASSAELALAWAAAYPRVTFYGCNSLGIGRFGDLCIYYLPHSQIALWCPQKVFAGIQETIDFEPDSGATAATSFPSYWTRFRAADAGVQLVALMQKAAFAPLSPFRLFLRDAQNSPAHYARPKPPSRRLSDFEIAFVHPHPYRRAPNAGVLAMPMQKRRSLRTAAFSRFARTHLLKWTIRTHSLRNAQNSPALCARPKPSNRRFSDFEISFEHFQRV